MANLLTRLPRLKADGHSQLAAEGTKNLFIMSIRLSRNLRNVAFLHQKRYILQPQTYSRLTSKKVLEEASLRSGISRGIINASSDAVGQVIMAWLTEGHSVEIPGLGTMRFSVKAKSSVTEEGATVDKVYIRKIVYTPSTEIKQALKDAEISVDGEVVESKENGSDNPNANANANQGGNTGGNTGGGSSGNNDDEGFGGGF